MPQINGRRRNMAPEVTPRVEEKPPEKKAEPRVRKRNKRGQFLPASK